MSDPRFREWLAVTERALAASVDELPTALEEASERREALQRSIEAQPPDIPPAPEVAERLRVSEAALTKLARECHESIGAQLAELKRIRAETRQYQPARSNFPTVVSRSV